MTDPTRAAAVAALGETLRQASIGAWLQVGSPEPGEQRGRYWDEFAEGMLDAILANPDHRRALLAVLLPVEELAALSNPAYDPVKHGSSYGEGWDDAIDAVRRLTEPTDTGSELAEAIAALSDTSEETLRDVLALRPDLHKRLETWVRQQWLRWDITEPTDTGSET